MAEVATTLDYEVATTPEYDAQSADYYLSYVEGEWLTVPEFAEWWPQLDAVEKEVIQMEWGIPEGRLTYLRVWAEKGLLTREQAERYRGLLRLVGRYRPVLERLFAQGEPVEERRAA